MSELNQLSVLCATSGGDVTTATTSSSSSNGRNNNNDSRSNANLSFSTISSVESSLSSWASLDYALLSTLTPMLTTNIKSAIGVDFVGEGRKVMGGGGGRGEQQQQLEKGGAGGGGPVITIHQVSSLLLIVAI